jgi:hypothetical protein
MVAVVGSTFQAALEKRPRALHASMLNFVSAQMSSVFKIRSIKIDGDPGLLRVGLQCTCSMQPASVRRASHRSSALYL